MKNIIRVMKIIKNSALLPVTGRRKKYPKVIQLPITYKCNSKCVMCSIWKMDSSNEATLTEFSDFLKDPIFKEVRAVGINGGEPSLVENLQEYAEEILKLPKIRSLNVISNGFIKDKFLNDIKKIYKKCKDEGVKFHVSISLDGVDKIHDTVRGKNGFFDKTISTINEIKSNKSSYCDSYDVGCTVVKQNVDFLQELDAFAAINNLPMKYRLGIPNKRIQSDEGVDQYSVVGSEKEQLAKEFFHYQMHKAKGFNEKFKYFSIFTWLKSDKPKRLMGCAWKDEGVTLDSRGNLYYCAVKSECIGSLRDTYGRDVFFDSNNIKYRTKLIKYNCDNCIHDYGGKPNFLSLVVFLKELVRKRLSMKMYRLWSRI